MGVSATDAGAVKKYHLVEAEEVPDVQQAARPASAASAKKKGKTSWSQFPLDDDATAAAAPAAADDRSHANGGANGFRGGARAGGVRSGERGGRSFGGGARTGGRGSRRNYDSNGAYVNGVYVPNTDPKLTAQWAKSQIEFYFSPDNLVRDIFLRQHMDVDGFVPLAFVGSFQAVFAAHQDYPSLLEAMKDSESVELDAANEKVRLRDGWQKWLWPNADGGYGVPRYIKAAEEPSA